MIPRHSPCTVLAVLVAGLVLAGPPLVTAAVRTVRQDGTPPSRPAEGEGKEVVTPSGLRYTDLEAGGGAEAKAGKTVDVLYTGWLKDGTQFDASRDPHRPFTFRIGIDDVLQGWNEGITGMKEGGRRRLVIPPELGYGKRGAGEVIPPNATLTFEVELLNVR